MKNIHNYPAAKYSHPEYEFQENGIYKTDGGYVTSLQFEQEPELDEGISAADISQYPLEDVLDRFGVFISDFYPSLNDKQSPTCYLEFKSHDIDNIINLRSIIGKHVYNQVVVEDGSEFVDLIIDEDHA